MWWTMYSKCEVCMYVCNDTNMLYIILKSWYFLYKSITHQYIQYDPVIISSSCMTCSHGKNTHTPNQHTLKHQLPLICRRSEHIWQYKCKYTLLKQCLVKTTQFPLYQKLKKRKYLIKYWPPPVIHSQQIQHLRHLG